VPIFAAQELERFPSPSKQVGWGLVQVLQR
jgi:hypothetical protein